MIEAGCLAYRVAAHGLHRDVDEVDREVIVPRAGASQGAVVYDRQPGRGAGRGKDEAAVLTKVRGATDASVRYAR